MGVMIDSHMNKALHLIVMTISKDAFDAAVTNTVDISNIFKLSETPKKL